MAKPEHLALLEEGVDSWNTWRRHYPNIYLDLTRAFLAGANLAGADLIRADLAGAILVKTHLANADLTGAILTSAHLNQADLTGANLDHASLSRAYLNEAILIKTHLSGANFREADLNRVHLNQADLTGANLIGAFLKKAILERADLSRAFLDNAILAGADLTGADLTGACLTGTDFTRANLSGANLSGADLTRADLSEANLCEANLSRALLLSANFTRANLSGINLNEANLSEANLSEANLSGADFSAAIMGFTKFNTLDLRTVRGLENVVHAAPSSISIDTFYRSEGLIPESFLRKAGIPEDFLTYLPSLVKRAIEYYTCFISHSSKDKEFVESLYVNLQAKGVRCWYAPEDLKIGDKLRQRIDESIRLYDKLLLVLSEESVKSAWVEFEVKAAFAKERRESRIVLFPIRLDDAVMNNTTAWAAHIKDTRHIGNFTAWKEHDTYQHSLYRLLRDLKAETRV